MKRQSVGVEPPTVVGSLETDQRPQHPFLQRKRVKRPRRKPEGVEPREKGSGSQRMSASAVVMVDSWCYVTGSSAPRPTTCPAWAWASGPLGSGNVLGITAMYVANLLPHFATSAPTHSVRNTKMGLLSVLPRMGNPTAVSMT